MMQRIIGTLKFQGLVLGAKFVLTAPCPVEESGVKGRLFLAKQKKVAFRAKIVQAFSNEHESRKTIHCSLGQGVSKK